MVDDPELGELLDLADGMLRVREKTRDRVARAYRAGKGEDVAESGKPPPAPVSGARKAIVGKAEKFGRNMFGHTAVEKKPKRDPAPLPAGIPRKEPQKYPSGFEPAKAPVVPVKAAKVNMEDPDVARYFKPQLKPAKKK